MMPKLTKDQKRKKKLQKKNKARITLQQERNFSVKEQLKRSVGGHLIEETFSDGVIDCLEPPNYQEIFNAYKVASADKKIDALEATFEKCGYGFDPEVNRR